MNKKRAKLCFKNMVLPRLSLQSIRRLRRKIKQEQRDLTEAYYAIDDQHCWGFKEMEENESDMANINKESAWLEWLDQVSVNYIRKNFNVQY